MFFAQAGSLCHQVLGRLVNYSGYKTFWQAGHRASPPRPVMMAPKKAGRLPGGDEVAVHHHLRIPVSCPGVDQIVLGGEEAGDVLPGHHLSGGQHPGAVTDGGGWGLRKLLIIRLRRCTI